MNLNVLSNFEMFSLEHFITLTVIVLLILILFVTRKFFIKYKYADLIFRVILAGLIIGSEVWLRKNAGNKSFAANMPIPLCGHLLWIAGIALLANSERIYRKVYPICLTAATLSMIVVAGIPSFPEFRFWQYFIVHGGFYIGALYMVFTRKINKFTMKDYGWSVLTLSCMGAVFCIFHILGLRDEYMIITPDPAIKEVYDALGQVGYTIVFFLVICFIMFIYSIITWACTRKRKDEDENIPTFKKNACLTWFSENYSKTARWVAVAISICAFVLIMTLQHKCFYAPEGSLDKAMAYPLVWVTLAALIISFGIIIFNEVLHNYEKKLEY